jgi:hypothetical protein
MLFTLLRAIPNLAMLAAPVTLSAQMGGFGGTHTFRLTGDTKPPIAMVGRRTIPTVEALELFKPTN